MTGSTPLTSSAAWQALQAHHAQLADVHLRDLFAADPDRATRLTLDAVGIHLDYSKHRATDETLRLLFALADERGVRARWDADVRRRPHQHHREPRPCCMWRCGCPRARPSSSTASDVVREVHAVLDRMAAFADRVRDGDWVGHTGTPDPQRRQHRHRRLRPRPGDGVRGAAPLQPPRHGVPVRQQRRRHRLRRGGHRPRPGGDAVRRLVQDVHDAGDDDERAQREVVAARRARP